MAAFGSGPSGGFFGSGGDASTTSSVNTTVQTDDEVGVKENEDSVIDLVKISNLASGAVVSVERTDYGALDTASKISELSFGAINKAIGASTGASQASVAAMKATALDALDTAAAANELDSAETMKYLIVTAGVIGVAYAWMRVKGG